MALIDLNTHTDIDTIRRAIKRNEHAHRARVMLLAAGLATLGILSVAGTFLATMF